MLFSISFLVSSQTKDTLSYADQLAALEAEMDSLSIFNLIESVMNLEASPESELNLHLGYTSSVTSAGRDFDINQRGYSPGISYYHKSGIYADLSGYWNSDVEPNYNPTILSFGYLNTLNEKWSYSFDYERWFFNPNDSSENSLTNSLGASINYNLGKIDFGLDYSLLFGKEAAHRIIGNLGYNINIGKRYFFDNISFYPNVGILYGNADVALLRITERSINQTYSEILANLTSFENIRRKRALSKIIKSASDNEIISTSERRNLMVKLINSDLLTTPDRIALRKIANSIFESEIIVLDGSFGLMNYSFSLPLMLSMNKFSFLLSYTYSVPVSLPGEAFDIDPVGFFGASVSYRIPFK